VPADFPDSDVMVTTKPKEREKTSVQRQPPYNVIIENDDYHTMDFVVDVLLKVLGCTVERAVQLTLLAHHSGRAIVWTGTKEVAELKLEQICTFHETRETDGAKLGPLGCTIEPAPGA
jgi:ATP-dependent Clp protease adaptor protein ClpS